MNPVRKRVYFELLIVSLIWGIASPIIKYTLSGFSPAVFLTYRFFISSLVAIFLFLVSGIKIPKDKRVLALVLVNGFLLTTVSLGLLFLGTNKTTSVDSSLISSMTPILIAISGVFFLKERVTKRESIGLLIALTGTFITIAEPIFRHQINFSGLEGNLLVFASIVATAASAVFAKKILRSGVEPNAATNLSFIVGFLTTLPFALPQIAKSGLGVITSVPINYHLGVLYMAIMSGTLGYILWHKAEKSIEISEVGLFTYLHPVFGIPISVIWLGEKITTPVVAGCVIIIIGVFLAEFKKRRYN